MNSSKEATQQVSKKSPQERNPTGRGGFGDNPQNQSPGGWKKEYTLSYQYKRFLNMNLADFEAFSKTPKDKMTMAEYGAYARVLALRKSLPDAKEIADRTEGKAFQSIDVTSAGEPISFSVINFTDANDSDTV